MYSTQRYWSTKQVSHIPTYNPQAGWPVFAAEGLKSMSQTADEISVRRKPAGIPGGVFVALILVAFLYGALPLARRPHLIDKGALAPSFTLARDGGGPTTLGRLRG